MVAGIFSLISEEKLEDILTTLHGLLKIPIQLVDADGSRLVNLGTPTSYCRKLQKEVFSASICSKTCIDAGKRAQVLGEAYVFSCPADLNLIAFPLLSRSQLLGTIMLGPFLMDAPDSTLVSGLADRYSLSPRCVLDLYDELSGLPVLSPSDVNHLRKLTEYLLAPLLPAERALLLKSQEKLYQQSKINETIQLYKGEKLSGSQKFFYEKESELLLKVRTGNVRQAKAVLNELLGHVLFSEGGKLDSVRTHAIELTTLLSRVAIDGGASAEQIHELNNKFVSVMNQEKSLDELCYLLQDMVESFMDAMFSAKDKGNAYVRKALQYISSNYDTPLTLGEVAAQLGVSPNYFSTLFHKTVGVSFREHLCRVRVEQSKRLLLSTQYPLNDIAVAVGFSDQSYYCKVFKRITGLSPGQYRA